MLSMKFLYHFLLPKIKIIFVFFGGWGVGWRWCGGGEGREWGGGMREGAGAT